MSQDKTVLINQALGGLLDAAVDQNYAASLSAIFQLAGMLGEKWLQDHNIDQGSLNLDKTELLRRKNENISNAVHLLTCMDAIKEDINHSILMPAKYNLINKTAFHAFYMGMTFGYLNPDFVRDYDYIERGKKNKTRRQETQRKTIEKITAWHEPAKVAYREVRANLPHVKSALRIRDVIIKRYDIPGMSSRALYDLVLQWAKEPDSTNTYPPS